MRTYLMEQCIILASKISERVRRVWKETGNDRSRPIEGMGSGSANFEEEPLSLGPLPFFHFICISPRASFEGRGPICVKVISNSTVITLSCAIVHRKFQRRVIKGLKKATCHPVALMA